MFYEYWIKIQLKFGLQSCAIGYGLSFNKGNVSRVTCKGVQKIKCANCGTMFMSETSTNTCPACSELGHGHGSNEVAGGCGCGHSH